MLRLETRPADLPVRASATIGDVVDAIGARDFQARLCAFLNAACGAEHCATFQLRHGDLRELCAASHDGSETARSKSAQYVFGRHWRRDPTISEVQRSGPRNDPAIIRVDPRRLVDPALRNTIYGPTKIRERIVIFGSRPGIYPDVIILSVLRSERHGSFSDQNIALLGTLAEVLIAIITKHTEAISRCPDLVKALTSLDEIELCLSNSEHRLPKRETQVCARMLLGMLTAGIALDLDIGEESVATYRKRAYARLGIGGRRELLLWYLAEWGRRSRAGAPHWLESLDGLPEQAAV